jgi:hypothetical protein
MPTIHGEQAKYDVTQTMAQMKYCTQLSNEDYPYNINLYKMFRNKSELNASICLGVAPKGLIVYDIKYPDELFPISTFEWSSLTKLNFDVT